ncbi:restriction endonuclease subunit S [Streptomyces sp. NPDC002740]
MSSEGGQWPLESLGNLCRVSSGTTPSRTAGARYFTHHGIPWVKTLDLNEGPLHATDESLTEIAVAETGVRIYPAQSVLLAMYGGWEQIGRTAILAVPAAVNQAISVLEVGPQLEPRYLLLALQHGRPRWSRYAASTRKDPNITKSDVLAFGVPVPPLPVQRKIGEVIESFTELGRRVEASIAKLRSVRQGTLLDFMGRIQPEWVPVRDLGEVRMGKQLSPGSRAALEHFPYLRVANVHAGRIDYSDVNSMGFTKGERLVYGLAPGDILLNEGQSLELVGRSAIYREAPGKFFFQNTLVRFRPEGRVSPEYAQIIFEYWLQTGVFAGIAKKTTSIAHLGGERFAGLRFPLVSLAEQQSLVTAISACDADIEGEVRELNKLRQLKLGLVDDLLSGRVALSAVAA